MLTLQEALNIDSVVHQHGLVVPDRFPETSDDMSGSATIPGETTADENMPDSFTRTTPLKEAELIALLMASPLYQKLERVKTALASGVLNRAPSVSSGTL